MSGTVVSASGVVVTPPRDYVNISIGEITPYTDVNPSASSWATGTSWVFASHQLKAAWEVPGGDYVDANGVLNGPTATITVTSMAATTSVNISAIDGDLFLHPNQGTIWNAKIDGVNANAFWLDPSQAYRYNLPRTYSGPGDGTDPTGFDNGPNPFGRGVMILNPTRGTTLTFEALYIGSPMRIDKVRGPAIVDLPMVAYEGALAPDIDSLTDPITEEQLFAKYGIGAEVGPPPSMWAYDTSPGVDAATGLNYLRLAAITTESKATGWRMYFPGGGRNEAYMRYCIWLEDSVFTGFNEGGVKLPGLNSVVDTGVMSARTWHGPRDPANPHVYTMGDYVYSAETNTVNDPWIDGYGDEHFYPRYSWGSHNRFIRAGRWYCAEQHIKNNTFTGSTPNRDGVLQQWLNGNLIMDSNTEQWTHAPSDPPPLDLFWFNIYHGGVGFPLQNMYYRVCKIASSSTRIGPPVELLSTAPSWMETSTGTSAVWALAPNSTYAGSPGAPTFNSWGRYAFSGGCVNETGVWKNGTYTLGEYFIGHGGGHTDYDGNEVVAYGPMSSETPSWFRITEPTSPAPQNVVRDANNYPVSSHTYDGLQWDPIANEMVRVPVGSPYSLGAPLAGADVFRFANNPAIANPWYPADGGLTASAASDGMSSVVDPATGTVWVMGKYTPSIILKKVTGATTWTVYDEPYGMGSSGNAAFDTNNKIMCMVISDGLPYCWNLSSGTPSARYTPSTTGTGPGPSRNYQCSVWDEDANRFIVWPNGGTTVYFLTPSASPYAGGTAWTWSSYTPAGGLSIPADTTNNHPYYGRFNIVRADGWAALIIDRGEIIYLRLR